MTTIETEEATVGLPEAADRLGVHRATVNDMVRSGRLPADREGTHWRIDGQVFEEFASSYVKPPNAPARRARGIPTSAPALLALLGEFGSASAAELAPCSTSTMATSGSTFAYVERPAGHRVWVVVV